MSKFQETLESCKEIAPNLMDHVKEQLSNNNITYISNSENEVIVDNENKKNIQSIIYNMNGHATKIQLQLMLDVTECKHKIFIRKNYN